MNKRERVEAIFRGEQADMIPAGFWFHYKGEWDTVRMAEEHLRTYRETGPDIYKVMQDYTQKIEAAVQTPSDWSKVKYPGRSSPVYQKLLDVLKRILDGTGRDAYVFQTIFSPFKIAVQTYGDALVMAHAKEAPDLVAAAVKGIAEAQTEWAAGFMEAGADGLFYAAQFSEPGRFTRPEWNRLVSAGDVMVMKAAESRGGKNILHICGEPEYQFQTNPAWYSGYSFSIVNWSVKDTGLSLEDGKKLFGNRPVLGGMNHKGNILSGTDVSIAEEVRAVIKSLGSIGGFILGADCTIQGEGISHDRIRAAVDAAHACDWPPTR
ncbi:uroporphyrinogen decarboxylase [Spirochaetia bacterium]|nr:uroporphyrinogen decarboxylase [Spirochaetia bacterium]